MKRCLLMVLVSAIWLSGAGAESARPVMAGATIQTSSNAERREQKGQMDETANNAKQVIEVTGTGKPVPVIFDTDMGPDCDDAGALAILNVMADRGEARILAVGHCTSIPWGAPCADAINHYYGRTNVPLGTLKKTGFLDEKRYYSYNRYVAQSYPNRFADAPDRVPDVIDVYRSVLNAAKDGSVTFVAVGPLCNLAALLDSQPDESSALPGIDLVRAKVARAVIMGGHYPWESEATTQPLMEWNFQMDPVAASRVVTAWPTEIVFSGFEVGYDIITGRHLVDDGPTTNPVRDAYRLHPDGRHGRSSWDLTAVHYAVRSHSPLWKIAGPGRADVNTSGGTTWTPASGGTHFFLRLNAPKQDVAKELDDMLFCRPQSLGGTKP